MRLVILIRSQTGLVVWVRTPDHHKQFSWVCTRDKFSVPSAPTDAQLEQTLLEIAQHSVALIGPILQVVQLEI